MLQGIVFIFWLTCVMASGSVQLLDNQQKAVLDSDPEIINEVVRGAPGRHQIALTFDAGDGAEGLSELLAALKDASVKSTFFLTGEWAQRNPNSVKEIAAEGHEIGNHSWSHPDLTAVSNGDIAWEIRHADTVIRSLSGRSTRPLFRAPFGARNKRVLGVIQALGYRSIYWSLDSLDSVGTPKSASFTAARIANQPDQVLDGAIVLFHVGSESTAHALPDILRVLKARDLECVVVSSLIPTEPESGRDRRP
jgi:peptidoglycan/xylan/chitin deacetylase (PgdA/CDA1 family)